MEYITCIAAILVMAFIMYRQQRTIERLTDKVMAKDYREYVTMQPQTEQPDKPTRKPLSWYDDPGMEEETH